jgi:3-hydroxybutyryl-CoA dehydratase
MLRRAPDRLAHPLALPPMPGAARARYLRGPMAGAAHDTTWLPFPEVTHVVGRAEIDEYAERSGDFNPLHVDAEYAAAGPFGAIVAHGPIGLQAFFEAAAAWFGGDVPAGVVVDVAYRGPVREGDAVTCRAQHVDEHAGAVTVRATCVNQRAGEVLQVLMTCPRQLAPRANGTARA